MGGPEYCEIEQLCGEYHLEIFGGIEANSEDPVPADTRTILL